MNEEVKDTKKPKKENKNEKIIKDLNDKIALLEDKNIRVQAEFINYRNRVENEKTNMYFLNFHDSVISFCAATPRERGSGRLLLSRNHRRYPFLRRQGGDAVALLSALHLLR